MIILVRYEIGLVIVDLYVHTEKDSGQTKNEKEDTSAQNKKSTHNEEGKIGDVTNTIVDEGKLTLTVKPALTFMCRRSG